MDEPQQPQPPSSSPQKHSPIWKNCRDGFAFRRATQRHNIIHSTQSWWRYGAICCVLCIRQHHAVWFWSCSVSHLKWIFRFLLSPLSVCVSGWVYARFIIYSWSAYAYTISLPVRHTRRDVLLGAEYIRHSFAGFWLNDFLAKGNRLRRHSIHSYAVYASLIHSSVQFVVLRIYAILSHATTSNRP